MEKNTLCNGERGITLMALAITIIVLMILAGVALNSIYGDTSVIENADRATKEYNNSVVKGNEELGKMANMIKTDAPGIGDDDDDDSSILDGNGYLKQNYNYTSTTNSTLKITIPKRFALLNASGAVVTSIEDYATTITDANITANGIVVKAEDGSEFVWVPVADVNDSSTGMCWTSGTRKVGQLYFDNSGNSFGTKRTQYQTNGGIGEATTVDKDGGNDNTLVTGANSDAKKAATLEQFQSEFEDMITSVETYGGFYVGRYETSYINSKVKSVRTTSVDQIMNAGEIRNDAPQNMGNWYGLYSKAKQYASDAGVSNVVTSCMIWGCAYDQIMLWMQANSINVKNTDQTQGHYGSSYINTGSNDNYKFNNIYDLCGNYQEWTMTSMWSGRNLRGGNRTESGDKCALSSSEGVSPDAIKAEATTRIQLFINI